MPTREPMSSIDTAWLRTDRPTNPMVIAGVIATETRLAYASLKEIVASRFLQHHRFRERVVAEGDGASWEVDRNFDLSFHVRRTALPHPAGRQELQELVSDLLSTPLDHSRPLWQFHLVEEYDGGSAFVVRIHHCYADGVALLQVLLSMTDGAGALPEPTHDPMEEGRADLLQRWFGPLGKALAETVRIGGGLVDAYFDVVLHPTHALDYARQGVDLTAEAARVALMAADSPTRFKGTPLGIKRAAWTDRLRLSEMKAVAHATGSSINDIVLSCTAGALRAYLLDKGDPVDAVELRALVPVNMRTQGQSGTMGNYFGGVFVLLPLAIDNPMERLYEVKRRMAELKGSSQALITLGLLAAVGIGPKVLQQEILDLLASRTTAVVTNVPGPQRPLYMADAKLREIVFWVPQSGAIGLGISVFSYDDGVQFGIVTDKNIADDPENIARCFKDQFEQLLWITLMGPWS